MTAGFHRLGADLLVVPEAAMVNLTAALLTVQPTGETLDGRLAEELTHLRGVERVAPRRCSAYRIPVASMAGRWM